MVAVPEYRPAFFPDLAGRCPARRRCCKYAKAMQVISACRCRPVQDRPSKSPSPSSCLSCWCTCSQDQRALTVAARRRSAVRGGRLLREYFFSPLSRHSPINQTVSPGRRTLSALVGPSATRTRTAAKRPLRGPLVPLRQVMRRQRCCASVSAAVRGGRFGTGCLLGRPVGVREGRSLTVVG